MIKTLLGSVRQYKKDSILTPVFVSLEVALECLLPLVMAELIDRMTTDVTNVQNAYQMLIRIAIRTPLMIIFSVVMCLSIHPRMALIFLVLLPILGVVLFGIAIHVSPIFRRIFRKYDTLNNAF